MADSLGVVSFSEQAVRVPIDGLAYLIAFDKSGPTGDEGFGDRPMGIIMLNVPTDGTRYWVAGNIPGMRDGRVAVIIEHSELEANQYMAVMVGDEEMLVRVSDDCSLLIPGGFDPYIPASSAQVLGILWRMQPVKFAGEA